MSNKLRLREVVNNELACAYAVQRRVIGRPWETIKEFSGTDKSEVLSQVQREFPRAKKR